jgi:hypothetical protein
MMIDGGPESQWRSGSASVFNARNSVFEPVKDKDFRVRMRRPIILGAGNSHVLRMRRWNEVQCVYAFRTSSTDYKDPAVSVRKKPACTEVIKQGKWEWCAYGSTDQSHLRMWHLLRTSQNIGQAPWTSDRMDMCAKRCSNQSIKSKPVRFQPFSFIFF